MRTLILMRHAKSDWGDASLSDHDRPLNKRGKRSAPLMAHQLAEAGLTADVILASSALRVQATIELLQKHWSPQAEVVTEPALYLATPQEIAGQVHALHDSWNTALVVGHNPGMAAMVSQLANEPIDMPTAAVAVFTSDCSSWQGALTQHSWQTFAYWCPRELESK